MWNVWARHIIIQDVTACFKSPGPSYRHAPCFANCCLPWLLRNIKLSAKLRSGYILGIIAQLVNGYSVISTWFWFQFQHCTLVRPLSKTLSNTKLLQCYWLTDEIFNLYEYCKDVLKLQYVLIIAILHRNDIKYGLWMGTKLKYFK